MRTAAALTAAVAAFAAAGCGGGSGGQYPASAVDAFVSSCVAAADAGTRDVAPARCACLIKQLERHMDYEDFVAVDAAMRHGAAAPESLLEYARGCADAA